MRHADQRNIVVIMRVVTRTESHIIDAPRELAEQTTAVPMNCDASMIAVFHRLPADNGEVNWLADNSANGSLMDHRVILLLTENAAVYAAIGFMFTARSAPAPGVGNHLRQVFQEITSTSSHGRPETRRRFHRLLDSHDHRGQPEVE